MSYKHPPLDVLHMADVVEDTTAVANLMGRFTFLNCYKLHERQFKDWSSNEPTLTLNNGKYVGYEAVKGFMVDYNNEQTKWANEVMRQLHPEELGGKSDEEIWAVGSNTVLNFTTPLIEVAFDGQTAKGMWYVYGATTEVYSKGPKAAWNFGRCAVDFIKEDGQWKIWHYNVYPDFTAPLPDYTFDDSRYEGRTFDGDGQPNEEHKNVVPEEGQPSGGRPMPYCAKSIPVFKPPLPGPYETWTPAEDLPIM